MLLLPSKQGFIVLIFLACCTAVQGGPRPALCWDELAPFSISQSDPLWPNMSRINNPAFNGNSSSSQPAFVVLPDSDAQVQLALACAVRNQLRVAVKAGGHSFAGYSTVRSPGFMINLSKMNRVVWKNDTVVNVQAGATWAGDVMRGCTEFRHSPRVSHTLLLPLLLPLLSLLPLLQTCMPRSKRAAVFGS